MELRRVERRPLGDPRGLTWSATAGSWRATNNERRRGRSRRSQDPTGSSSSIRPIAKKQGGASSRPPATACWWSSTASLTRVQCAAEIQRRMGAPGTRTCSPARWIQFRIGINLGDVIVRGRRHLRRRPSTVAAAPFQELAEAGRHRRCPRRWRDQVRPTGSTSRSRISASKASRTSPGRSAVFPGPLRASGAPAGSDDRKGARGGGGRHQARPSAVLPFSQYERRSRAGVLRGTVSPKTSSPSCPGSTTCSSSSRQTRPSSSKASR